MAGCSNETAEQNCRIATRSGNIGKETNADGCVVIVQGLEATINFFVENKSISLDLTRGDRSIVRCKAHGVRDQRHAF